MECRNTPIERPPMLGYKQSKFDKKDSVFCYFILCGVIPDIDGFLQILTSTTQCENYRHLLSHFCLQQLRDSNDFPKETIEESF